MQRNKATKKYKVKCSNTSVDNRDDIVMQSQSMIQRFQIHTKRNQNDLCRLNKKSQKQIFGTVTSDLVIFAKHAETMPKHQTLQALSYRQYSTH